MGLAECYDETVLHSPPGGFEQESKNDAEISDEYWLVVLYHANVVVKSLEARIGYNRTNVFC